MQQSLDHSVGCLLCSGYSKAQFLRAWGMERHQLTARRRGTYLIICIAKMQFGYSVSSDRDSTTCSSCTGILGTVCTCQSMRLSSTSTLPTMCQMAATFATRQIKTHFGQRWATTGTQLSDTLSSPAKRRPSRRLS